MSLEGSPIRPPEDCFRPVCITPPRKVPVVKITELENIFSPFSVVTDLMVEFSKITISNKLLRYAPILLLLISVLNEFDFNYLKIQYFSFNFVYILIFYWTLRSPNQLGYISIFLAGIINDVIMGLPIGISSLCYLLICSVTAYIRNITLIYNFINDKKFKSKSRKIFVLRPTGKVRPIGRRQYHQP